MFSAATDCGQLEDTFQFSDWPDLYYRQTNPQLDYTQYAFVLPDGSPVGISYPAKGKKKRVCYYADKRFYNFKPFANKHKMHTKCEPRFELWAKKYSKQWAFFVDIDKLTRSEYQRLRRLGSNRTNEPGNEMEVYKKAGEVLAEELQERMGNSGYVFTTNKSGLPKIIIVIEYDQIVKQPSKHDIVALLKFLLPEYIANDCIELTRTAFSTAFIPWQKRDDIRDGMRSLIPFKIKRNSQALDVKSDKGEFSIPLDFRYYICHETPNFILRGKHTKKFILFLRCLCTMSALAKKGGFAISQKMLARTLGIKQTTASRYIRKAIKLGYISLKDAKYIPDKKAKIYEAQGALLNFLKAKIKKGRNFKLPKKISDGQWHSVIISTTKFFKRNPAAFMSWFKSIPGWDKKDRLHQAIGFEKWLSRLSKSQPLDLT